MVDDTQQLTKRSLTETLLASPVGESSFCGISIRGWLAIVPVGTMCFREVCLTLWLLRNDVEIGKIEEPLYTVIISSVSFYFGQKVSQQTPTSNANATKG